TFKMAVALAGLEEGIITPDFHAHCAGAATFYGRPFKCWKKGGHGSIDLRHAIERSCDVYFYTVVNMVGVDKINKWATALGLGVKSGIDLPNEVQGLVPSTQWKREKMHEKWYAGETISAGTGHNAQLKGYDVSGKTGTSQVISNQGKAAAGKTTKDLRDNGWFVFFAPRDHPQIAGVVFLEHGVHGSNAALIARHILETFFAKKEARELPPKPELQPNLTP